MGAEARRGLQSLGASLCVVFCGACGDPEPPGAGNVLLLIADDLGTDKVAAYGEHPQPPATPNLDALAARGVLFRNAYAPPACSPSRAAMLTGRIPRRYGLGIALRSRKDDFELPLDELTLPELLATSPHGYSSSAVGKWHLAGLASPNGTRHPLRSGFGWYAGAFGNFRDTEAAGNETYFDWEKSHDGELARVHDYATSDTVDDALARIRAMSEPWFLWVAFNAPHYPLHEPPQQLRSGPPAETIPEAFAAVVGALDSEIGRLLAGIAPAVLARTSVVFVGDNGTPKAVVTPPRKAEHGKLTLYEGGVNVPLIIAGPEVARPGSESPALVHVADIFPTVAQIAGVDPANQSGADGRPLRLDGRSLLAQLRNPNAPGHEFIYQDLFAPNGPGPYRRDRRMLRDARWKLISDHNGNEQLFDLKGRNDDGADRIEEPGPEGSAALARLRAEMQRRVAELDADRSG